MALDEAVALTREKLFNSVNLRLRSDVPLAFCLSGGVDSTALASIAAKEFGYKVATFSIIDSDERYNEADNINATVADLGCEHTAIELSGIDTIAELKRLVAYHDAPVATITALVHSLLMRAIAERGYRVVVSGIGADELFSGYYDHPLWQLAELKEQPEFAERLKEWQQHIRPLTRNPLLRNLQRYLADPSLRDHIYYQQDVFASYLRDDFTEAFTEERFTDSLLRNRMLNEMFHEGVRLILHEDDLNGMLYSIENRNPYLDRQLFEAAYTIPTEHLLSGGFAKQPLRQAVAGIVPDPVRLDRRKRGFNASFRSLIGVDDAASMEYLLSDSPIFAVVDREKMMQLARRPELPNSLSKFLFSFLSARLFLEAHADGMPAPIAQTSQQALV
jgi:asparagine synthase (glutamine-hydrolysing)